MPLFPEALRSPFIRGRLNERVLQPASTFASAQFGLAWALAERNSHANAWPAPVGYYEIAVSLEEPGLPGLALGVCTNDAVPFGSPFAPGLGPGFLLVYFPF